MTKQLEKAADEAWKAAEAQSHALALAPDDMETRVLWRKAVMAAARAQWEVSRASQPAQQRPVQRSTSRSSGVTVRFGRNAGQAVENIATDDLRWYEGAVEKSIDDPNRQRFRRDNETLLAAIRQELARR